MAVAIEFGSQGSAASSSSVATIAGMDFNAAVSDRILAVTLAVEANITFNAVTIGGVSASVLKAEIGTSRRSAIWAAAVPTGTSGDVVVTLSADATISASTFSVTGAEITPTDTDSVSNSSSADLSITGLTIPSDGAGLCTFCNGTQTTAVTWTGASESHDTDAASVRHSAAIVTTVGTNTITADGATANNSLVGVAFGPASGGGTIEGAAAQTLAAFTQSAPSKLRIKGAAAQTFAAFTQSAASDLRLRGAASQTLAAMTNASASKLRIKGTA